jgi:hypothetical protein
MQDQFNEMYVTSCRQTDTDQNKKTNNTGPAHFQPERVCKFLRPAFPRHPYRGYRPGCQP